MPARLRTEGTPAGLQWYKPGLARVTLGSVPPKLESWAAAGDPPPLLKTATDFLSGYLGL